MSTDALTPIAERVHTMRPESLVIPWVADLTDVQGRSKETVHAYACHVRRFLKWLPPGSVVADLTTALIRRYKVHYEKGHSSNTVMLVVQSIRSFCKYLVDQGYFLVNPASAVEVPKKTRPKRTPVSNDELLQLLAACDRMVSETKAARSRALLLTFAHTGFRRSEVLNLQVSDIDLRQGSVTANRTKGNKNLTVYPHVDCLNALRDWLKLRPKDCQHTFVFALDRHRRVGDIGLRNWLKEMRTLAGLKDSAHIVPHGIRHNYATRLLRAGANLEDIREALGHTSIMTTQEYLHHGVEDRRRVGQMTGLTAPVPKAREEISRRVRIPRHR